MNIKLPIFFGLILILFGTIIIERYNLYYRFSNLDTLMHFIGGFTVAWFTYAVYVRKVAHYSKLQIFVMLMSSVFFVGWLWELAEYLSTIYSPVYAPVVGHYFHIGDFRDTVTDVFVGDFSGGIVYYVVYLFGYSRTNSNKTNL